MKKQHALERFSTKWMPARRQKALQGKNLESHPIAGRSDATLDSLSGLRAVSVLLVVGGHLGLSGSAPNGLGPILRWTDGNLGVRVFFCISGFLITYLLLREKAQTGSVHLREFYIRRALRIFPAYYTYVAVIVVVSLFTRMPLNECQVFTAITFIKNYACGSWIDGHLWSLAVEEQFYLLWPFIIARCSAKQLCFLAGSVIALAPVSRSIEYFLGHRTFFWLFSNSDALMVGSLGAMSMTYCATVVERIVRFHPPSMRLTCCVLMLVPGELGRNLLLGGSNVLLGTLLQAILSTYLILSLILVKRGVMYDFLNARPTAYVGLISYSVYLWQQPFFAPSTYYGLESAKILTWPYNCLAVAIVAVSSYYCLERPFAKLRKRYGFVNVCPKPSGVRKIDAL